jgi:hypothetical protein
LVMESGSEGREGGLSWTGVSTGLFFDWVSLSSYLFHSLGVFLVLGECVFVFVFVGVSVEVGDGWLTRS